MVPSTFPKGVPYVAGKDKVAACTKHFDGGTVKGVNENGLVIDRHGLMSIHMPAYYNSIIKGVPPSRFLIRAGTGRRCMPIVNLSHISSRTPSSSEDLLSLIGGRGLIESPTHPMQSTRTVQASIEAGTDMLMVPHNYTEFPDTLFNLVKSKVIPMSCINDAVRRILRVKFQMGLFENLLADYSFADNWKPAHRDLAREEAVTLVLLKNGENVDSPVIPLSKNAPKILVAGTHADNLSNQCGG